MSIVYLLLNSYFLVFRGQNLLTGAKNRLQNSSFDKDSENVYFDLHEILELQTNCKILNIFILRLYERV